jgi:membrane-bound metal-dependent hydrolase YbcI (DUF457 family)
VANAAEHGVTGFCAGTITYLSKCHYHERQPRVNEWLICATSAALIAGVPDFLEPSLGNPNHRQFAHSVTVGALLTKFAVTKCANDNTDWNEFQKIWLAAAITGYLSHLAADAFTPRRLPVV